MKGMSVDEYSIILSMIQGHCAFGYTPEEKRFPNGPMMIKYVDTCWDSRFGDIWFIEFRGNGVRLATNHFNSLTPMPKY
jgi:hypothetical protein